MKNKFTLIALFLISIASSIAQELSIDAEIRPRFEYRHGFQDPAAKDAEPSAFVSQRSAVTFKFTDTKVNAFLSLQDVSVWGDRPQLERADGSSFRVQQAWAKLGFGSGWGVKLGRQQLSYDDQRILGGLAWAQQARTHDAALLQYGSTNFKMDIGFAFNQNSEGNIGNIYEASGAGTPVFQYKSMQYLHLNRKWDTFSGSFLFMNNGFQGTITDTNTSPKVMQRQTTGVHLKYKEGGFGLSTNFYYQFGAFDETLDVAGYLGAIDLTYKPGKTLFGLGFETLSGNDVDTTDKTEAFFPLFGTNHKFNGFMDYFYVGRHANNVGLNDFNAKIVFKTGKKSSLLVKGHYFTAAKKVNGVDENLASEIDLVFAQKLNAYSKLNIGYSQAFVSDDFTLSRIAGTETAATNNWGWIMLTIKPNLLKWKKPAPAE